jgi:CRP/FNR family transcriptional regulator
MRQTSAGQPAEGSTCPTCLLSCALARVEGPSNAAVESWPDLSAICNGMQLARPRQTIYRAGEVMPGIPIICDGWAARVCRLADGRRQILSFLLPGDLVSPHAVFAERMSFYVESITTVRHTCIDRAKLNERLVAEPSLAAVLLNNCLTEIAQADQLATNLGRRCAEERIASLFLHVMEQQEARGLVRDQSFDFPLRQQHIADATGLTSIHVNRIINKLRNDGLIELDRGVLKIIDLAGLRHIMR